MCETRHELKLARTEYKSSNEPEESAEPKMPRQKAHREAIQSDSNKPRQRKTSAPKARGDGPRESSGARESSGGKKEWTVVSKNGPQKTHARPRQNATVITIQSN
jgi:hypothetical protein